MSNIRIESNHSVSLEEYGLDDPSEAICRATFTDGTKGRPGNEAVSGAGGASGVAEPDETGAQCLDEMLTAAGTCGASFLSAGALALVAGVACVGSTWTAIECLQREANERR